MKVKTYEIIDGRFRVFNLDDVVFDSDLQTQNIFLSGVADVPGRQTTPAPGGGVFLNPAYTISIALGRTLAAAPYVRSFSRRLNAVNSLLEKPPGRIYPQWIAVNGSYSYITGSAGHYTSANNTTLYVGNLDGTDATNPTGWNGARRVWYNVFANLVG